MEHAVKLICFSKYLLSAKLLFASVLRSCPVRLCFGFCWCDFMFHHLSFYFTQLAVCVYQAPNCVTICACLRQRLHVFLSLRIVSRVNYSSSINTDASYCLGHSVTAQTGADIQDIMYKVRRFCISLSSAARFMKYLCCDFLTLCPFDAHTMTHQPDH